jgi:hypothetical protein
MKSCLNLDQLQQNMYDLSHNSYFQFGADRNRFNQFETNEIIFMNQFQSTQTVTDQVNFSCNNLCRLSH